MYYSCLYRIMIHGSLGSLDPLKIEMPVSAYGCFALCPRPSSHPAVKLHHWHLSSFSCYITMFAVLLVVGRVCGNPHPCSCLEETLSMTTSRECFGVAIMEGSSSQVQRIMLLQTNSAFVDGRALWVHSCSPSRPCQ